MLVPLCDPHCCDTDPLFVKRANDSSYGKTRATHVSLTTSMSQRVERQCVYVDANTRLMRQLLVRVIASRFPDVYVSDDPSMHADVVVATRFYDVEVDDVAVRGAEAMLDLVERSLSA